MLSVKTLLLVTVLGIAANASAGDIDGRAVVGGALGGATGAAIGSAVGGRDGAVIGAGIGGAAGAAVATSGNSKTVQTRTVVQKEVVVVHEDDDYRHDHGKHKGWYKHKHHH